jgi:26S proteasome regulatory subunit N1
MVQFTQGLTHLGKGIMFLSPFHTDQQIMNHVAVAGLLAILMSFLDKKTISFYFKTTLSSFYTPAS